MKITKAKRDEIVDELLDFLIKELGLKDFKIEEKNKRETLNYLMLLCPDVNLGDYFFALQDKLLESENEVKDFSKIKFKNKVAETEQDLLNFNADVVAVISNQLFANDLDFTNIDNQIILKAGLQLKGELYIQLKQNGFNVNHACPYYCEGYNLPCQYFAKIVYKDDEGLIEAIKNLYKFAQENNLKTVCVDLNSHKLKGYLIELKPKNLKLVIKN